MALLLLVIVLVVSPIAIVSSLSSLPIFLIGFPLLFLYLTTLFLWGLLKALAKRFSRFTHSSPILMSAQNSSQGTEKQQLSTPQFSPIRDWNVASTAIASQNKLASEQRLSLSELSPNVHPSGGIRNWHSSSLPLLSVPDSSAVPEKLKDTSGSHDTSYIHLVHPTKDTTHTGSPLKESLAIRSLLSLKTDSHNQ
jgi:hypothetical protein